MAQAAQIPLLSPQNIDNVAVRQYRLQIAGIIEQTDDAEGAEGADPEGALTLVVDEAVCGRDLRLVAGWVWAAQGRYAQAGIAQKLPCSAGGGSMRLAARAEWRRLENPPAFRVWWTALYKRVRSILRAAAATAYGSEVPGHPGVRRATQCSVVSFYL